MAERRKELVGEGHRFFDAMRNNKTIVRYESENDKGWHYSLLEESRKFGRTYFRAILPIPISEVNANSVIAKQQNPGYLNYDLVYPKENIINIKTTVTTP